MRARFLPWLIILITVATIFIDLPIIFNSTDRFPLKLGLDLQGGTQLILQVTDDKIDPLDRDNALDSVKAVIERRVNLYGISEAVVQTSKLGDSRRILVELPGLKDATNAANLVGKVAELEFKELGNNLSLDASESAKSTGLTGKHLKRAQVTFGGGKTAGPQVAIEFTSEGANKFAEITRRNIGRPLPIFLDNEMISSPVVEQEITGNSAVITGNFTLEEAKNLTIQLNAGALPVPVKIIETRHIGPTLGQQSLNKSLMAGVIGLLTVMIYIAVYYSWLGVVADGALIIYALVSLAIFKTGLFILPPITLTLAGIAGFILSIGMAVDANILIFERMKEEIRWGKSRALALELGFNRAWSSIWASNVSSILTAGILFYFGTSLVKGFAVTLAVGVLVSMFTAIVVTRTILRFLVK